MFIVVTSSTGENSPSSPCSFLFPVYGKPILPTSSTSPSPVPFLQARGGGGEDVTDKENVVGGKGGGKVEGGDGQIHPPPNVDNIPRPLSPTKLTPVGRHQRINLTHRGIGESVTFPCK